MKIAVLIPSRSAPRRLQGVLQAYHALKSGQHEIEYCVVCDSDDTNTALACHELRDSGMPMKIFEGTGNLYSRINAAANVLDADATSYGTDDNFPLAWQWDVYIAHYAGMSDAFTWQEKGDPENCCFPVVTRRWLAATKRMFPEYFPFWFSDTWIREVHDLAFGKPINIVASLPMAGQRGTTRGMHDLKFWFDFFSATRIERIEEAKRIAIAVRGSALSEAEMMPILQGMEAWDASQLSRIQHYERIFNANIGEPSPRYIAAKKFAYNWYTEAEASIMHTAC